MPLKTSLQMAVFTRRVVVRISDGENGAWLCQHTAFSSATTRIRAIPKHQIPGLKSRLLTRGQVRTWLFLNDRKAVFRSGRRSPPAKARVRAPPYFCDLNQKGADRRGEAAKTAVARLYASEKPAVRTSAGMSSVRNGTFAPL
jgi:hypothetical protein